MKWDVRVALDGKELFSPVPHRLFVLAGGCFAAYWVLFGWWSCRKAYRMGRLNAWWAVLFFALNVLAYLLYVAGGRLMAKRWRVVA